MLSLLVIVGQVAYWASPMSSRNIEPEERPKIKSSRRSSALRQSEIRFDPQFVHAANNAADVVRQKLAKQFIHLSDGRFRADEVSELPLDGAERRFSIRAFVIRRVKFFLVHAVEMEQSVPSL